ncbi:helix-turn-helix domain-containing protein [Nocardioides sp.]|uniref:helix-turn-helix domain-containing protein n=1 Tax=Nocardioides sp. TaxID=35761 RepID=UPI002C587A47|nr:helix-turn-helix domain-containing protein [Nocardioides sp.]HXH77282.1 helix-turn-helix domain-containing protein [Nocardioides sp.]
MSQRLRFNTAQAAEHAICHPQTVLKAAAAGVLHGSQKVAGGRWTFRLECIEAWLDGQTCEHSAAAPAPAEPVSLSERRARSGASA